MNALETMALTEKQQEKVQVSEKQPGKITVGVKRADERNWMKRGWSEGKFKEEIGE